MTVDAERPTHQSEALQDLGAFPLVEALYGRRSRRFALGPVFFRPLASLSLIAEVIGARMAEQFGPAPE